VARRNLAARRSALPPSRPSSGSARTESIPPRIAACHDVQGRLNDHGHVVAVCMDVDDPIVLAVVRNRARRLPASAPGSGTPSPHLGNELSTLSETCLSFRPRGPSIAEGDGEFLACTSRVPADQLCNRISPRNNITARPSTVLGSSWAAPTPSSNERCAARVADSGGRPAQHPSSRRLSYRREYPKPPRRRTTRRMMSKIQSKDISWLRTLRRGSPHHQARSRSRLASDTSRPAGASRRTQARS
jgi:hypothetical protein